MQVKVNDKPEGFKPVEVTIRLESEEELAEFAASMYLGPVNRAMRGVSLDEITTKLREKADPELFRDAFNRVRAEVVRWVMTYHSHENKWASWLDE